MPTVTEPEVNVSEKVSLDIVFQGQQSGRQLHKCDKGTCFVVFL